jgi:hypothetical protein
VTRGSWGPLLLAAAVIAVGGYLLWGSKLFTPAPAPAPAAPPATAASAQRPAETASAAPIELPAPATPLAASEVAKALTDLLGRKAVASFLQLEDFPRRLAATVDNLGRAHAPAALWPVNPTPGRFTVEERDSGSVIAADNGARYTPFVLLAEGVDAGRAADLYVRMYPLLQRSYQELGYPKGYFNERVLAIIDLLLATPAVESPVKVQLAEVKGPVPSLRPWVRYEYADPALESLSAGQKILLRVGPVNARRLKAKLVQLRQEIVARAIRR